MMIQKTELPIAPRGTRRILYCSDPSSILLNLLPNPVEPDDLRRWVDMLADSGVDTLLQDVYNQGYTVYWRSDRFQYDQRAQHQAFLPMLDAGVQPLQVLLDHSHKRGMAFIAGFRMNDTHVFPALADFIESHPQWWLRESREGAAHQEGKPLDFTFDEVREFVFEVMREVVSRFDVDGLEMTFRDPGYFPFPQGRDRAHLMTGLVRRLRGLLDERSHQSDGRRILLGARVFSSLEECLDKGLDVATWIAEGFIDYLSPGDTMFSDFNAPYAEFGALTRNSRCMLYPGLHPWTSHRKRMQEQAEKRIALTPSIQRALAQTFYASGADGISLYNHFVGLLWFPPFYPQTLWVFHELRDPERVALGDRHYVFDPAWEGEGVSKFGPDRSLTGAVKEQRVVLDRSATKPSAVYRFRLYEQIDRVHGAVLFLRGAGLTGQDELEVQLNGTPMVPGPMGRARGWGGDWAVRKYPNIRWFLVPSAAVACGENRLNITLTSGDAQASGEIIVDEVEVWVQPRCLMSLSAPIGIHPDNPKLFEFRGKPLVLVTATEHYGAVMNRPFDYRRYLRDAAEKGITLSRLFLLYRELQTPNNPYSTCKPESPDYIAPFERVGPARAFDLQPVYDLDRPNPEFYQRLHDFVRLASECGLIVEVVLFSNTYSEDRWCLNPLNAHNNVNDLAKIPWYEYTTRRHPGLYARQVEFVRRVVRELNTYDNIIWEICNEPCGGLGPDGSPTPEEVNEWLSSLIRVLRETEAELPNRHLVAGQEAAAIKLVGEEQVPEGQELAEKAFAEMDYDVVNVHPWHNTPYGGKQYDLGRFMQAQLHLKACRDYCLDTYRELKPLNLDEDNCASQYKNLLGWTVHRKRAWTVLMCGCHYDYIDFSIQPHLETGTPESQRCIRSWMGHLSGFIHSVDLVRARPLPGWLKAQPEHTVESALAVQGEDYCVYLADERELDDAGAGNAISGEIVVDLPSGTYKVACYSPTTGLYSPALIVEGAEDLRLQILPFVHDVVVRITRA